MIASFFTVIVRALLAYPVLLVALGFAQLFFYDLDWVQSFVPKSSAAMWIGVSAGFVWLIVVVAVLVGFWNFITATEPYDERRNKIFWLMVVVLTLSIGLSGVYVVVVEALCQDGCGLIINVQRYVFIVFANVANVVWFFVLIVLWGMVMFSGYGGTFRNIAECEQPTVAFTEN